MTDPGIQTAATGAVDYNITTPEQWANALLQYLGFPQSQGNIEFLVAWAAREGGNWNNTASYNPLNTTLKEPGSTVMSGGNTAGVQAFQSWQQGIAATAATLNGYSQITAALKSGNAMQADQSGSLSQDFLKWSGNGYTSVASAPASYATTTGTGTAAGGSTGGNPIPSANDIAALDSYVRQNFGTDAWLLDIPDVKSVLEQAVANGDDAAQVQAAISQTEWWKTTSQAVKSFEENSANNPADYNFNTPGSTASQALATVRSAAAQAGLNLSPQQFQILAGDYMRYGWTSQQLTQNIGNLATTTATGQGNAQPVAEQVKQVANEYYMTLTPAALESYVRGVASGTQTLAQVQAQMSQDAALKWTGYAQQLRAGYTMTQLTDNLRNEAAKTMEVDPNSIDFINNPTYSKILDFVPPNSPNGVHRVMTLSEMDQHLKSTDAYGYTQGARDNSAQLEQAITTSFGKVG